MKKLAYILLLAVLVLSSCSKTKDDAKIKIGYLPDAGILPMLLMDDVELVPFFSAGERNTAMQLGELDGMMSDLVAVIAYNQQGINLKVLTVTESRFMIVGTPDFSEDQKWSIGISDNTVIEYLADELGAGEELDKVSIPKVPVRVEMLGSKKIPLACLTDAMAWSLLAQGFQIVRDQKGSGLEPAVLVFTEDFVSGSSKRLKKFASDWNRAAEQINSDPEKYRSMMLEQVRLPDTPDNPYPMPVFRPVTLPTEAQLGSVLNWYKNKYGLEKPVNYSGLMLN